MRPVDYEWMNTILVTDGVASAESQEREDRRGVAGLVYAFKLAGAKAEIMADLKAVTEIARKIVAALRREEHRAGRSWHSSIQAHN